MRFAAVRLATVGVTVALALTALAPSAAAQTLERIQEAGEIRIGFRTDAEPLSFQDADGQPAGYSPLICGDVAGLVGQELGVENLTTTFVPVGAEDRFDMVASGEIDLLCGAASITLSRRETVDFSIPTFVDGTAVLLPQGADPEFSALDGKPIGVRAGTTTEQILNASLESVGLTADVKTYEDHAAGLAAMEAEEIVAYFGDQSILYSLLMKSDMAEGFAISDNTLTMEKQGLALARGDADFRLAVDRALSTLYDSGRMVEIFRAALPGAQPGPALQALFLLAPELP
jgi:polar amino acid transport system substrate-binding protein/glutamate/aspartate transport system substrate-binding protein